MSRRSLRFPCGVFVVAREAACVAAAASAFALLANALSPRGLALGRDHVAGTTPPPTVGITGHTPARSGVPAQTVPKGAALAGRLEAKGLRLADSNEVTRLFRDPRYALDLVVFVDARDDRRYRQGHVPGALALDPYRPDRQWATVLPVCQTADEIVVYCHGGECNDSELAAALLTEAGIPRSNLRLYGGGFEEWVALKLPIETGERKRPGETENTP